MRKFISFGSRKGESSLPFTTRLKNGLGIPTEKNPEGTTTSQQGYNIRGKDLRKIHRAAIEGNVAKVQQILLLGKNILNERDKTGRTALHLACANGHPDVVTLLVERKCQLNLYDKEHRTALMKAVQCQEERCVAILLENGADPNLTDNYDNTALHYAVVGGNTSIVEKLILHHANIEARNKFDLTPFLLAVNENKQQMVEFLIGKEANIHGVDKSKSNQQIIAKHREERRLKNFSQNSNAAVDKNSEEDSLSSISVKAGDGGDDSWPTSDDEDLNFNIKNTPKPSLRELMTASQHFKNLETKCGHITLGDKTLFEDDSSDCEGEVGVGALSKPSIKACDFSCPALPSSDTLLKPPLTLLAGLGDTKEGEVQPAIAKKDNDIDAIESAPQEQTVNDCLTSADRAENNRCVTMSALGLGEEEDGESSWDSESISESLPGKCTDHLSETPNQKWQSILNEQVEDSLGKYPYMKPTVEVKEFVLKKTVEMKEEEMSESDLSEWKSTGLNQIRATCQRSGDLKLDDKHSSVSQSMTKSQSASTEFKHTTLLDKQKISNSGAVFMLENYKLHDVCESQLPVRREHKEDLSAELDLGLMTEEEEERIDETENKHLQIDEEMERHQNNEMTVLDSVYAAAAGVSQQIGSGKTDNYFFPTMENEESDGDPALDMKEVRKWENEKQTSKESVIPPVFEKTDSLNSCPLQMNEDSTSSEMGQDRGRSPKKTSNEKKEVKKEISCMDDFDDLTPSSETTSEDSQLPYSNYTYCMSLIEQLGTDCKDSRSLLKIQDAILSYERLIELKKNQCGQLKRKNKKMENKVNGLQKELSEAKEMLSQLELQKVEWEQELGNLRFDFKQEKEKRKSAEMLYENIQEHLIRTEEQYNKEVEMTQQLQLNLRRLDMELRTVKNDYNQIVEEQNDTKKQLSREQDARILQDGILNKHLSKQKDIEMDNKKMSSGISNSHENEKYLLHKNHTWQDQIAALRLEIETINKQNWVKERKYCEDIEFVKEKNVSLQKTIKLNEETLTKTVFQYSGQINALTTENTMLKSKLENEKQNKERLEARVESYQARLATAIQDHDQTQTSKRDLELTFQRAKVEWFRVQDKLNFDVSNLKDNNELLSQNLSKAESKFNTLEIELHRTRDALREKTLVLERVQRDLSQAQCQKKEIEQMYQNEQDKVSKFIGKQESLKERLSQLQSENMLLQQQLDDAHNKASSKENVAITIQDQFQDVIKKLQAESQKQNLLIEQRNKELINECNLLKERMYEYEKEKVEREVAVRQLQVELADTLKKLSISEASLEVTSCSRMNLEDEAQDLKKKVAQLRNQLQDAQEQHAAAVRCIEKLKDHVQKLEVENAKLKGTIKKQAGKIEQLQENVLSTSSSDDEKGQIKKFIDLKQSLECSLDQKMKKNGELGKEHSRYKKLLKVTRRKVDDLTAKLETVSSKNQVLTQELSSMKEIQTKCKKLEKNEKKLEQQVVNLKSCVEASMVEYSTIEQYKRELEERARLNIAEKLKEINLFLQTQVASQESLGLLRENNNASQRSEMELRIKDLEFEIFKMKSSQEDPDKIELDIYRHLYLEEIKLRTSLTNELNKTSEKLAETSTKLLMEKQQKDTLFDTFNMRPPLDLPYHRNVNKSSLFSIIVPPRENVVIPTTSSWPSSNGIETYLTKMQQELEKSITRELEEGGINFLSAAEFTSDSPHRNTSLESTSKSYQNCDQLVKSSRDFIQSMKRRYKF